MIEHVLCSAICMYISEKKHSIHTQYNHAKTGFQDSIVEIQFEFLILNRNRCTNKI